jgi:hypothetical protein
MGVTHVVSGLLGCGLLEIFNHPVAYGKVNDRNDLYDLRLMDNPPVFKF